MSPQPSSSSRCMALLRRRWDVPLTRFILLVALANAALYHGPLYLYAVARLDAASLNGVLTLITLLVLLMFVTSLILGLLSLLSVRLIRPLCIVLALGNALALYFIESYGVVLDKTMMGNVLDTNVAEAGSYFHPRLLLYVLAYGVVPAGLLMRMRVVPVPLRRRALFLVTIVLVSVGWAYANAKTWLWIDDNARRLGGLTLPWSYISNTSRQYLGKLEASRVQALLPAASAVAGAPADDKTIVVLVIGESARAANFSLYGYPRPTNPQLAEAGVVVLPHTRSCSTYTTASLLCILSHLDQRPQAAAAFEPLPSYLQRHDVEVVWRTNNWGEPALKVQSVERAAGLRKTCQGESCAYDEVLLTDLEQRIRASARQKVLVVLHQGGSHGPDYSRKYPPSFERYSPACKSVELQQCSSESLVNAYDNTILYTDDFLRRTIDVLKAFPQAATLMMYISDHGESLGEYGLYLHGTPYSFAPDVQKDIPFLVWSSDRFRAGHAIAAGQLAPAASHSQAQVFHSVMGAFGLRSEIYRPELDLFSSPAP